MISLYIKVLSNGITSCYIVCQLLAIAILSIFLVLVDTGTVNSNGLFHVKHLLVHHQLKHSNRNLMQSHGNKAFENLRKRFMYLSILILYIDLLVYMPARAIFFELFLLGVLKYYGRVSCILVPRYETMWWWWLYPNFCYFSSEIDSLRSPYERDKESFYRYLNARQI